MNHLPEQVPAIHPPRPCHGTDACMPGGAEDKLAPHFEDPTLPREH